MFSSWFAPTTEIFAMLPYSLSFQRMDENERARARRDAHPLTDFPGTQLVMHNARRTLFLAIRVLEIAPDAWCPATPLSRIKCGGHIQGK
jgi:hypothetical protein